MDTFEMLKRLLSQNEFELLLPDQTGAKEKNTDKTDIRLVYQMNDTIESFLVFKEARYASPSHCASLHYSKDS